MALEETTETRQGDRTFRVWRLPVRVAAEVTHVVSLFEDVTERRLLEEHRQILLAIEARDAQRARSLMTDHIAAAMTFVFEHTPLG